jgi:dihydroorotate dehydrogenase
VARALAARDAAATRVPVLLKIAPDLEEIDLDGIASVVTRRGIDGVVVSNTLVARPALREVHLARETGGLSGRPIFARSTKILARTRLRLGPSVPLIGVGGVDSGDAAWTKIRAGASLVQLYTALIYKGLPLIDEIKETILRKAASSGRPLAEAVGAEAEAWARGAL